MRKPFCRNSLYNLSKKKDYISIFISNRKQHKILVSNCYKERYESQSQQRPDSSDVHTNKKGIVRQREVARDTQTFASGLRAALRQDPDIIAIGEMRDYETIKTALTAAETGILVISTLHIISIDKMIERILSYAPDEGENTIRFLLAETLQGVIHQELLPLINGQQRVACEIMTLTNGVKNILRSKGGYHLRTVIETGKKFGMCTMSESIEQLLADGSISPEIANRVLLNYK